MRLHLRLAIEDIAFDSYAREHGLPSRSAVVQRAIRVLRVSELRASYGDAWKEWASTGDHDAWQPVVGDGL